MEALVTILILTAFVLLWPAKWDPAIRLKEKQEGWKPERIVAPAIRHRRSLPNMFRPRMWSTTGPGDHADVLRKMYGYNAPPGDLIYGFRTDRHRFVNRIEAGRIAFNAGQTFSRRPELTSEDLWPKRRL